METIYVDELFVLNLAIDYFLLLATAKVCALPYRRGRFAAGAVLGAGWCCLGLVPGLTFLNLPVLRPVLALGMTLAAFGDQKKLFRCLLSFLGVSALFGGAVYAAALGRGRAYMEGPLLRLDMGMLILSFALCWAAVGLLFRRGVKNARRGYHTVTVEKNGRTVRFQALEDTGNDLYDPITGCAAFVAEAGVLKDLFPNTAESTLRGPPAEVMETLPGMRLIPCSGIGGGRTLLLAFRPDRVTVDGEERRDLIAAISPTPIGTDGAYRAVL